MSRIHEALKRAEQEKVANYPTAHLADQDSLRKTPESIVAPTLVVPSPVLQEGGIAPRSLRFEDLQAHCSRPGWNPDLNTLVFYNSNPFPAGAEQFRTLRSRLYKIRESQPLHSILISSSVPMEGKTTVAANLAHAFVRQSGCRTLLIDGDLRSPRLDKLLGAPLTPGLADYLQGEATETDIIQAGPEEGLFFVPAGVHVTHPAELISNGRMKKFLDRVGPLFEWIVVDSPPVVPVSDATVLAGMCDGVLLIVRSGSTLTELAQKACQELKGARVLGVVLNTAEDAGEYGTYYGYGSGKPGRTEHR
jgi:capsular exopolysaccharide synthesis family protein